VVLTAEVRSHARVCGACQCISRAALRHGSHVRRGYFTVGGRMDCGHRRWVVVTLTL
jgi:hypothetical protein